MKEELSEEKRNFFNYLRVKCSRNKHKGYVCYVDSKTRKRYRRSRVLYQLYHNVELDIFDIIHHKDGNKENDKITNLELLSKEEHANRHFAGKRKSGKVAK